jgi:hypothetical protein
VILHRIRRAKARFFEELLGSKTHIVLGALRRAGMGSAAARRVRFSFQGPSPPREANQVLSRPGWPSRFWEWQIAAVRNAGEPPDRRASSSGG